MKTRPRDSENTISRRDSVSRLPITLTTESQMVSNPFDRNHKKHEDVCNGITPATTLPHVCTTNGSNTITLLRFIRHKHADRHVENSTSFCCRGWQKNDVTIMFNPFRSGASTERTMWPKWKANYVTKSLVPSTNWWWQWVLSDRLVRCLELSSLETQD